MTVSVTRNRRDYTGNGTNDTFAYDFRVLVASHLKVYVAGTLKVLNTHYTLTGVGTNNGGNVIFGGAYIPANQAAVVLVRDTAETQETDYTAHSKFPAESHELALDKLTLLIQDLNEQIARCIQLGITSVLSNIEFPPPGAGEYIRWNNAGTALETNTGTGSAQNLSELGDVNIGANPVDGEALTYDSATQKWVNRDTGIGLF